MLNEKIIRIQKRVPPAISYSILIALEINLPRAYRIYLAISQMFAVRVKLGAIKQSVELFKATTHA